MKKIKASGVHHVVKKKGKDIVVEHPTIDGGKYDKINLTKKTKGKVKTIKQGIKSTKEWHKENPHTYKTKSKPKSKK
jgi:hypothetical protein